MKKWGIIITSFYALIVIILLIPLAGLSWLSWNNILGIWIIWVWVGILVSGQAILLLVSVDSSWKRLKQRQHIWVTLSTIAILFGILTFFAIVSLLAGVLGDKGLEGPLFDTPVKALMWWFVLWLVWGILFFLYIKGVQQRLTRVVGWLLRGSVLELIIAVSCHVIVRHRHECSAPIVTYWGIATGIAIMLLSFGPSVLFLYKKRMEQYSSRV